MINYHHHKKILTGKLDKLYIVVVARNKKRRLLRQTFKRATEAKNYGQAVAIRFNRINSE